MTDDIGKQVTYNFIKKYKEVEQLKKENKELQLTIEQLYKRIELLTAKLGETEVPPADLN